MMQNSPIRYTWDTLEFRVLQYVDCAGHTGAYMCVLYLAYWCLDMCTVLGILVLRCVYCAVHTGA